jgi:hypothetical protein
MATIKFKRGSSDPTTAIAPSGLTIGEPVFNTSQNKFWIHNGTTGIWVGAEVDNGALSTNSQVKIPTQFAVKTYVDSAVSVAQGGAVTSVNGVTGPVVLAAGTGVGIAAGSGSDKGITFTNTGVQSLTLSVTTNGGLAVSGAGTTGALSKDISLGFSNLASDTVAVGDLIAFGDITDSNNPNSTTVGAILDIINGDVNVDSNGTSSIASGAIVNDDISASAGITVTKLAAYTISGHTLGNNLSTLTIGTGLGGTSYNGTAPITITNTGVTQLTAGTGISVNASTGSITVTNTGVQSLAGTANEIEVITAATGAVQIGLPDNVTIGGVLTVTGNLTVNGTTTTVNSSTLQVDDSLVQLAKGNSASDTLDIGIYGLYDTSGSQDLYAGFFRDATDDKFKLFKGLQAAPTNTVNTAGTGYTVATLVANLEGTATTATNVTTTEASGTYYLAMASAVSSSTGIALDTTATALTYNTATSTLTAGTFSGALSGTATNATNVAMLSDTSDTTCFLSFVNAASDSNQPLKYNSGLAYNASTNTVTVGFVEAVVDGGAY